MRAERSEDQKISHHGEASPKGTSLTSRFIPLTNHHTGILISGSLAAVDWLTPTDVTFHWSIPYLGACLACSVRGSSSSPPPYSPLPLPPSSDIALFLHQSYQLHHFHRNHPFAIGFRSLGTHTNYSCWFCTYQPPSCLPGGYQLHYGRQRNSHWEVYHGSDEERRVCFRSC